MTLANIFAGQVLGVFTQKTQIVEIENVVDLFTSEVHDLRIRKTAQPIEDGSSITDNSVVEPQSLRMAGYVSNLVPTNFVSLPAPERGKEAWAQIEELARKREPVNIVTTLRFYENFLITALSARSDERTGTALDFVIELQEIQFANSEFVTLPADTVTGPASNKSGTVEGGIKQSPELSQEQSASLATKIVDGIGNLINGE